MGIVLKHIIYISYIGLLPNLHSTPFADKDAYRENARLHLRGEGGNTCSAKRTRLHPWVFKSTLNGNSKIGTNFGTKLEWKFKEHLPIFWCPIKDFLSHICDLYTSHVVQSCIIGGAVLLCTFVLCNARLHQVVQSKVVLNRKSN